MLISFLRLSKFKWKYFKSYSFFYKKSVKNYKQKILNKFKEIKITFYHTPVNGSLRPNPNIKPSFKEGDFVVWKKDCISTKDSDGPCKCLVKGESFEIHKCRLSKHEISKTKINSKV